MVITLEILKKGLSSNGGYSIKQIRVLGIDNYLFEKGWKLALVGSDVPKEKVDNFIALKDAHLKKAERTLFET